ncbi:MAG: cytoplasmic protein [Desulfobacteraceae bacterium 4572_87]|nr:MAG: cytoplasmic protein [Desulfobacteraceae bacterium 4572_87]
MKKHTHDFVEEYNGLVGYGLDREGDEHTITYYLQKFSDDTHMALMRERMSEEEMTRLFDMLTYLLKQHLSEEEYHSHFLKDEHHHS